MSSSQKMTTPSVRDQVSAEEWQLRTDLAALYRLVAMQGWDDFLFTHLSARVPGPEHHFLLNPLGMTFDEVTASSLVKVDLDGNKVMETPYDVNAAGFTIHSAVHAAREDAICVMHLHTNDGVAVSAMEQGLMPISQHAMQCGEIAYHDYEGVALDLDERERIVRDLGDKQFMLLRNHGTLTVGPTICACWMAMFYLERSCTMQVRALAGGVPNMPPQGSAAKAAEQSRGLFDGTVDKLAWPALLRKLDRVDDGYRL
ncbi:MAG TPA: class II aldolase/adducin family protein [Pseudomonadales bacterium]|nr:class II aldolase/adducin family protein [Pseudomonadales bacterium]